MSELSPQRRTLLGGSLHRLAWIIPLGILGNLAYTLLATDREAFLATLDIRPAWLAVALGLALLPLWLNTLRVWRWARVMQPGFPWRRVLHAVLLAEVGAAVTPSVVGGSPLKVASLSRDGLGTAGAVTVAAMGTIEDVMVLCVLLPCLAQTTGLLPELIGVIGNAMDSAWPGRGLLVLLGVVVVLGALVLLALRTARGRRRLAAAGRWWRELAGHMSVVRRRGLLTFPGNLLLTAVQWASRMSIVAALAAGLGVPLEPLRAMVLQWLCFLVMMATPTPGAVGGAEAGFLLVFGREIPHALVPVILAAWRFVGFYGLNLLALGMLGIVWRRNGLRRPTVD